MKLKLGVIVVPEPSEFGDEKTTYDIGMILEKKYKFFTNFYKFHEKNIKEDIEKGVQEALEVLIVTKKSNSGIGGLKNIDQKITDRLHKFVTNREIETMGIKGVPTEAALLGLTLRTKSGKVIDKVTKGMKYKEIIGDRRPSFIYSGVFEKSLIAWIE